MFLKKITTLRPFLPAFMIALPLLLSACAPRLEEPAYVFSDETAVNETTPRYRLDPDPRPNRPFRAGLRRDFTATSPSPRELREARAMVMAQSDALARTGSAIYRGDGSASSPDGVRFTSAPGALTLDYAASDRLNIVDDLPHALRLVTYHLSDRAELDRLASHEDGIRRLLEGEYFDPAVKSVRVHHAQPGSSGQLLIDRADGGRFVALVAGYDKPRAGTCVYVTEYGLGQWKMEGESVVHRAKNMYSPLPLHLQAVLGDESMAVRDTGAIHDRMKRVTRLTRRQAQYVSVQNQPFPLYSISE